MFGIVMFGIVTYGTITWCHSAECHCSKSRGGIDEASNEKLDENQ